MSFWSTQVVIASIAFYHFVNPSIFLAGIAGLAIPRLYFFLKSLRQYGVFPGMRPLFSPAASIGASLPSSSWNPGLLWQWNQRQTGYFHHTQDIISIIPILHGKPMLYTFSGNVMKQLFAVDNKKHLEKPPEMMLGEIIGDSVASVHGELWQRHRRAVAPSFNAKLYARARRESFTIYDKMIEGEGWINKGTVTVPTIKPLVHKFALLAIARCAFNISMGWEFDKESVGLMNVGQATGVVTDTLLARVFLPQWAFSLPVAKLQEIDRAWAIVSQHLKASIHAKRYEDTELAKESGEADVLSRLVASIDGGGKHDLSEDEVLSNLFTVLFAGHETTASGLTTVLTYLALYHDEQEKVYQEIKALDPIGGDELTDDVVAQHLPYLVGCFREALRLYSPTLMSPRQLTEDVAINITRPEPRTVVLNKGLTVLIDMIGVGRDPEVFEDPDEFKPSRWESISDTDNILFGYGPRACLGKKFAQTVGICCLFNLLRDWRFDVYLREGQTRKQCEEETMRTAKQEGTAFGIGQIALTMIRRT